MKKKLEYTPRRISASYIGRMVRIVPTRNAIEVYFMPSWFLLLSVWIFGGALFFLSFLLWENLYFNCIMTVIGGVGGFILTSKNIKGKLKHSYEYSNISCIILSIPELTIFDNDEKLVDYKILTKPAKKLIPAIVEALQVGRYDLLSKNNRYYIVSKEETDEITETKGE